MSDAERKPRRRVERSARNQRALLWLAIACVALNLVAIGTLYLIWRGIRAVERRESGLTESELMIEKIESRLMQIGEPAP